MKHLALIVMALACTAATAKDHAVKGHIKKDGTYVAPTRATDPNKTQRDNYSSKGNTNPANGKPGSKEPKK